MIKLFPELRRPWSDGLTSSLGFEEYLNPFEQRYGLFGGGEATGGGGSDEDMDQDKQQDIAMRNAAGSQRGTTFGVDGVSKTGSTALDAAIGFTAGDNTNRAGPNYGSLKDATAEQMSVVKSVAAQASQQGLDSGQTQAAVKSALDNYETGSVTKSGGLTDKGQTAVQAALSAATTPAPAPAPTPVDRVLGTEMFGPFPADQAQPYFVSPQITTPEVNLTLDRRPSIPQNAQNMSNVILSRRIGSPEAFGVDTNIAMTALQDRALQGDTQAQDLLDEAASRGDISQEQADYARGFQIQGVTVAPRATAEAVLGPSDVQVFGSSPNAIDAGDLMLNPELAGGIVTLPTAAGTVRDLQAQRQGQLQGPPQFIEESRSAVRTVGPQGQALEEVTGFLDYPGTELDRMSSGLVQAGTLFPVPSASVSPTSAPASVAMGALPEMEDAETDIFARDLADPNRPGYSGGLPEGLEYYTRPDGVRVTRNLAGLTEAQRAEQPFYMDVAGMMGGRPYGYELDPQGNVVGMVGTPGMSIVGQGLSALQNLISGPPQTTEDLLERGVYTGMSLQQPETGGDGEQVAQAPMVDPCPPGYEMVDGVCQPTDDLMGPTQPAQPGSNFVINPTTGLPTLFQPTTQATPVGQISPFVLQPYAPMQAQQIGQARAGIQALSPTGAALGRQV